MPDVNVAIASGINKGDLTQGGVAFGNGGAIYFAPPPSSSITMYVVVGVVAIGLVIFLSRR